MGLLEDIEDSPQGSDIQGLSADLIEAARRRNLVMEPRYYCRATLAFSIDIEESSRLGYREDLYRFVQTTNPLRRELIEKQPRPQLKPCGFCDEKRCSEQFGKALDSRGEIYRVSDRCILQPLWRSDAADDCWPALSLGSARSRLSCASERSISRPAARAASA